MSNVFPMPEIGEGVLEGEIVEWKVKPGESVAVDQPLCEVMTDKASVEVSSPRAGVIARVFGEPGDMIKIHAPLVEFGAAGVVLAPTPKSAPVAAPAVAAKLDIPSAPTVSAGVKAAPAVRRHAREAGVDLANINGSGPGGRVTHDDVIATSANQGATPYVAKALPQVTAGQTQRVRIIGLRRKIAEQMTRSKHTAAHFTYVEEADCENLVQVRGMLKQSAAERGIKLSYLPFVLKACSLAFREFPNFNARMDEDAFELVVHAEHHIGFACDTPGGLMVPIIKNVEQKSVFQIGAEMADLTERVRVGKARLDELTGGTFTVTGVGTMGVLATPILNVPEVAILGFNAIRDQVVFHEGVIQVRKRVMLSGSFDHRIIDGAEAARFTARVRELLENPGPMLLEVA